MKVDCSEADNSGRSRSCTLCFNDMFARHSGQLMGFLALRSRPEGRRGSASLHHCAGTASHTFYLSVTSKQSAQGDGAACAAKKRPCERKIQLSEPRSGEFWIFLNGFRLVEERFSCSRRGSRLRLQTDGRGPSGTAVQLVVPSARKPSGGDPPGRCQRSGESIRKAVRGR